VVDLLRHVLCAETHLAVRPDVIVLLVDFEEGGRKFELSQRIGAAHAHSTEAAVVPELVVLATVVRNRVADLPLLIHVRVHCHQALQTQHLLVDHVLTTREMRGRLTLAFAQAQCDRTGRVGSLVAPEIASAMLCSARG
jgi:hypothetical protein